MFIELIDSLRCPADHPPSNLVAAFDKLVDRDVVSGMLGCPVCRSEFQIRDGELLLTTMAIPTPPARPVNPQGDSWRIAASLDLRSESGFAILAGPWGALASAVAEIVPTHLVLLDPPFGVTGGPGRSVIRAGGTAPFVEGAAQSAAVDDSERAYALSRAVRPGGRVVGPVNVPIPSGSREVARDERWWVAERTAPGIVQIGRRPRG